MNKAIENEEVVTQLKSLFAPDGGAEREHNAAPGTLGFGLLHYSFVRNLRPSRALVIGSRYGYVPSILALAMQANGEGEVDFVDANYDDATDGFEQAFGGVGFWEAGGGRFAELGLADRLRVHIMRSEQFFDSAPQDYGYVYLDGDHSYAGCRYDLEQALQLIEPASMITLHDVLVTEPAFGVCRVFDELDCARYHKMTVPVWPGLGIVQPR